MCSTEWADHPKGTPASSFYRHKEGRCTCTPVMKVVVFSLNRGGAVVEHCGKYTVGYGAGRGCRPGHRPRSCGDHAGVLAVPTGGVAAFRRSCRPGSCPGQGRRRFRGLCPCRSGAPRKGKYERGMGSWQHSSWSSAEHILHCVAGSHSVATAPGSSDRSWRTGLRSLQLWGVAA